MTEALILIGSPSESSSMTEPHSGKNPAPAHLPPSNALQSPLDQQKLTREQLSSQDLVELTSFSHKKDDIDQKIQVVSAWPELDAFRNISTHTIDEGVLRASRAHLESLRQELNRDQLQREQLDAAVQHFNVQDMNRLRKVAKEVSKRHLSSTDTDLIELALNTVYALDKLLRLLRNHKSRHDLTELRIQWESMLCSCWEDLIPLQQDVAAFRDKCERLAIVMPTKEKKEPEHDHQARSAVAQSRQLQHKRSLSSCRMAAEAIMLEDSRLILRISSFNTDRVLPTGRLLDVLIDQRQIPEKMIDEQERLEEAIPLATDIEEMATKLVRALDLDSDDGKVKPTSKSDVNAFRPLSHEISKMSSPAAQRQSSSSKYQSAYNDPSETVRSRPNNVATPSKNIGSPQRSESARQGTPLRVASSGPNRYRPDPLDKLDMAVGNTINQMAIKVSVVPVDTNTRSQRSVSNDSVDLSGRYWVGHPEPRLCFCRVLKSHTVMVRVGGGWQELSDFITQHYAHLTNLSDVGRLRTPLQELTNSPATPRSPWLRSAPGPADPSVLANARFMDKYKSNTTPTSLRVVTMPVSSSPTPLAFNTSQRSRHQPTPLSFPDAHETSLEPELSKSESSESIIIKDAQ